MHIAIGAMEEGFPFTYKIAIKQSHIENYGSIVRNQVPKLEYKSMLSQLYFIYKMKYT